MTEVRGKAAVIVLVCIVAGTTFASASLGPALGLAPTTGIEDRVEDSNAELENSTNTDGVTDAGTFNPVSALGIVGSVLSLLGSLPSVLQNLGVPATVATWVGSTIPVIIGLAVVQIVLRQRL